MTEEQRELLRMACDRIDRTYHLAIRMMVEGRPEVLRGFNEMELDAKMISAALRPFLTPPTDLAAVAERVIELEAIVTRVAYGEQCGCNPWNECQPGCVNADARACLGIGTKEGDA